MRNNIVHYGAGELTYEIRAIVDIAERLRRLGVQTAMENIGDPVAKGERIPLWFKRVVAELAMQDETYGYSPTKGLVETREFLAARTNARNGVQISADDVVFFNGLGDAIQKVYGLLRREARVIGPSPTYSTHSSAEGAHAAQPPVCYRLDPANGWLPDLDDLRLSIKYNPAISGILVINPDNPTGAVYAEDVLREIVALAKRYDLFLICDEIYHNLVFPGFATRPLSDLVDGVPCIAMKGISKELPWPGARCGWIEVYNAERDATFARYVKSIVDSKMVEVCSTTLPQKAIPRLLAHPEFPAYLAERVDRYARYAELACSILGEVEGVRVNPPRGAFYLSVVFDDDALRPDQTLTIADDSVRALIEGMVADPGLPLDKRFVYYLLGATGVCVVPLSSFHTPLRGFRVTLLEQRRERLEHVFRTIARGLRDYLASSR